MLLRRMQTPIVSSSGSPESHLAEKIRTSFSDTELKARGPRNLTTRVCVIDLLEHLLIILVTVRLPPNFDFGFPLAIFTATTPTTYHLFLHTPPGTPVSVFMSGTKQCMVELEIPVPLDLLTEEAVWDVPDLMRCSHACIIFELDHDIDAGGVRSWMNGEGTCEIELAKLIAKQLLHITIK